MRRRRGFRGLRGGGLLRGSYKELFEETQELTYLRPSDEERRKQAKREVMRAIDEQAFKHGLLNERSAIDGKLDANHQAFATDFADEREFCGQRGKAFAQFSAARAGCFPEAFRLRRY